MGRASPEERWRQRQLVTQRGFVLLDRSEPALGVGEVECSCEHRFQLRDGVINRSLIRPDRLEIIILSTFDE